MDKFASKFFSMQMMTVGLFIFLFAIGAATFVESVHDTQTAKMYIYNALWFNLLLAYLGFNLIANIFRYRLFSRGKIAILAFHLAFLVILIGAAITRFVSFEGQMLIPEKGESNVLYSAEPYVFFRINDGKQQYLYDEQAFMSELDWWNGFSHQAQFPNHPSRIDIEYVDFKKKMVDSLVINDSIRTTSLEFVKDGQSHYISEGGFLLWDGMAVSYNKDNAMPGIELFKEGNKILMRVMKNVTALPMSALQQMDRNNPQIPDSLYTTIPMDTLVPLQKATLYNAAGVQFVFKDLKRNAKMMKVSSEKRDVGKDILTLRVTDGKESKLVDLEGGIGIIPDATVFQMNGLTYEMSYGAKQIQLPFSIACRDFQLDRYPGSDMASSYASEVTIIDNKNNFIEDRRIFMNNFMDYGGYRFFQSSYFSNEQGTILSVNHDRLGTMVTYIGYLLMGIGMILSLIVPGGRFRELNQKIKKQRERHAAIKNGGVVAIALLLSMSVFAQEHDHADQDHTGHDHSTEAVHQPKGPSLDAPFTVVSKEHSEELADLLVQDFRGRIIPMHTLCDQLIRKIHRGTKFKEYNAIQTIISAQMYPAHWMAEDMIYVSSKGGLRDQLGIEGKHISFAALTDTATGAFILEEDYQLAHRKLESKRNEYDKQIVKLGEKYRVLSEVFFWQRMNLVPLKGDPNNTWYVPMSAGLPQGDKASGVLLKYFNSLIEAGKSGNFSESSRLLKEYKRLQRELGGDVVPEQSKVDLEIRYNKMNIFQNSNRLYVLLGFSLLLIFFIRIFVRPTKSSERIFNWIQWIFAGLLLVTFLYHGYGLWVRSQITGHAPWSDGYEAIVFIAWAVMLFGLIFVRKNPVILAGAAILAFLMLFVSDMNLLDPDITPLQPVLKSYWLQIHVAVITGSYAPLGLACILGLLNMFLYTFRSKRNKDVVTININELTYISEMMMTIGVFMLTIGTFLGGVWANESWGRYWGWDPKETWALVAVLVYAVILHFRFIPGMKGKFLFNALSFWGYSSILFTFFGVNFMLVGLHSYAQGEGLGEFPGWLIITILVFAAFTALAAIRNAQFKKSLNNG